MQEQEQEQEEIYEAWAQEAASIGEFNRLWEAYLDELELHAQAKQDRADDGKQYFLAWKYEREGRWHVLTTIDSMHFWRHYLELHRQYTNKLICELLIKQEV